MSVRKRSISPEALLIASIVSGCATPPPEEYRLPTGTTAADFLQEVRKAAALTAQCSSQQEAIIPNSLETPSSPAYQAQRQLSAVYHFFSWQHTDRRQMLIEMLQGFTGDTNCAHQPQMEAIIIGLEQCSAQLAARDAAIDARSR